MINKVCKKIIIKDYKARKENQGKVALYDIDRETVLEEGEEEDWQELQLKMEELRLKGKYCLILVPVDEIGIQAFGWRLPNEWDD